MYMIALIQVLGHMFYDALVGIRWFFWDLPIAILQDIYYGSSSRYAQLSLNIPTETHELLEKCSKEAGISKAEYMCRSLSLLDFHCCDLKANPDHHLCITKGDVVVKQLEVFDA